MSITCTAADRCRRVFHGVVAAECRDCSRNVDNHGLGKHHDHLRDNFDPLPGQQDPSPWGSRPVPHGYVLVANVTLWLIEVQRMLGEVSTAVKEGLSAEAQVELLALSNYIRGITDSLEAPRSLHADQAVRDALLAAAQAFRDYEAAHTAKAMNEVGSADRLTKADVNRRLAERMEAAAQGLEAHRG